MEYFIACVDTGSIAGAALALNVSQPTISVALAKLEAQFGVQLLLRHHAQGVSLTPSGTAIVHTARSLLAHATDLESQARLSGTTLKGDIRLGSFSTLAPAILPGLIQALSIAEPDITLRLQEGPQDHLITAIMQGQLDLAVLYDIDLPDGLRRTALTRRAPYVALPLGHPLAKQADIALAQLVDLPLILLDVAPSRGYFLGVFERAGLTPKIGYSSPSLELVRGMVGQGLGYAILVTRPEGDLTYEGRALAIRPLRDDVEESELVLVSLQTLRATRLITRFEDLAVQHFES